MLKKVTVFVVALCIVFVSVVSVSAAVNHTVLSLSDYTVNSSSTMSHRFDTVAIPVSFCSMRVRSDGLDEYRFDSDILNGAVAISSDNVSFDILTPAAFGGDDRYFMSVENLGKVALLASTIKYSLSFNQQCKYDFQAFSRITFYDVNFSRIGSVKTICSNSRNAMNNYGYSGVLTASGSRYKSVDVPNNAKYFCVDYVVRLTNLKYSGDDLAVSYSFDDWSFTYGREEGIAIVSSLLTTVIGWVATVANAFLSPDGALNSLLPLLAIFVAVPAMFFGVRAIRYFIWGA